MIKTVPGQSDYLLPPIGVVLHVISEQHVQPENASQPVVIRRALRRLPLDTAAVIRAGQTPNQVGTPDSFTTMDSPSGTVLWLVPAPAEEMTLYVRAFPPAVDL